MIKENVSKVQSQIQDACRKAGRNPSEVTLVAVTKLTPIESIEEAIQSGITDIAENRVQEAQQKFPTLVANNPSVKTHIIGHLQTNKAKDAIAVCGMIQSVDSIKLAQEIEKQATKAQKNIDILIQFNIAEEEQKFGANSQDALNLIESIGQLSHIKVKGFMCMAPYTEDQGIIRKTFSDLRMIRDQAKIRFSGHPNIQTDVLSMGMSGDYAIAIEEGSTMIRVGSAIFKEVMQNA